MNPLKSPIIVYLLAMLQLRIHRARTAPSKGASAVEWVIITAIIAAVALGLATLIRDLVTAQQEQIANSFESGGGGGR